MGISKRCKGLNLLNHIKQKGLFETVSLECKQLFELSEKHLIPEYKDGVNKTYWHVTLKLDNNTYTSVDITKKGAILNTLEEAENIIYGKLFRLEN